MAQYNDISDFCSRLRNGQSVRKLEINVQKTNKIISILRVLKHEGFVRDFIVKINNISVLLKYCSDKPTINKIIPISNRDRFANITIKQLKQRRKKDTKNFNGLGIFVLSTPKGILSDQESINHNTGGQILLRIL